MKVLFNVYLIDIKGRVNQLFEVYLKSIKRNKSITSAESPEEHEMYTEILKYQSQRKYLADEKIDVIDQIDRMLGYHILQLDRHIERFRGELKETSTEQKSMHDELLIENQIGLPKKRKFSKFEREVITPKRSCRKMEGPHTIKLNPNDELLMVYCKCQKQRDDDQMVECDASMCKYKWFHFSCVGLKEAPREDEKWYCPDCSLKFLNKHK